MEDNRWTVLYALPNVLLRDPVEASCVAIVPYGDSRVKSIISISDGSKKLLNGFIDQSGRQVLPSVLLIKENTPTFRLTKEAIVAFRNIVAISCLVRGWSWVVPDGTVLNLLWSDYFDFYPVTPGKNGALVTDSPALQSYRTPEAPFIGMKYPHISMPFMPPTFDKTLLESLTVLWETEVVRHGKESSTGRKLFRSLQMAYQAAATPIRNQASVFDWGTSLGIWISAFETLAHPQTRPVQLLDIDCL